MWIDFASLCILLLFATIGLFTGGLRQLLRLVASIVAFVTAPLLAPAARPYLGGFFTSATDLVLQGMALIVCALAVYLALVLVLYLAIERSVSESLVLTAVDRLVGGAIGAVKAVLLLIVLGHGAFLLASKLPPDEVEDSQALRLISHVQMKRFLDTSHLGEDILQWMDLKTS